MYQNFWDIHNYNNVYTLADMTGNPQGAHAVTIVGYDDTMSTRDGHGAFRLVNSMGTAWGDSGYFWMSYQAAADRRIVYAYAGFVTDRVGYQPKVVGTVKIEHPTRDRVGFRFGIGTPESSLWHEDFRSWRWAQVDHSFPDQRIPFDLTDGADWLIGGGADTLYVSCVDDTVDGRAGFLNLFEVEHLEWQTQGSSPDPPVMIPDWGDTAHAVLRLPFSAVEQGGEPEVRVGGTFPTVLRGPELARLNVRVWDATGRDVTDRRERLAPGLYFVAASPAPSAVRKVVVQR
jgi:hypothetical protein